jgi:type VI secretion system secreted protein VgrG
MSFVQTDRLLRMTKGPLAETEVFLTNFSAAETISRLFTVQIEFQSPRLKLTPADVIGKPVTLEIDRRDANGDPVDPQRFFHGYINRFSAGPVSTFQDFEYRTYRAVIVPWLWFLTQTARCFIFFPEKEEKSIYEVIEAVFKRTATDLHVKPEYDLSGIADLKNRKVKHCVQYRETDFNFVSRIMEQYGVHYCFKHEDGKHTLLLSNRKNYPKAVEADVVYNPETSSLGLVDHIYHWEHAYEFVSGEWEHTDYNFETPATSLLATSPKISPDLAPDSPKYEIYDFPGEYAVKPDGDADARVRQEEEEVPHNQIQGESNCRTFSPGFQFTLSEFLYDTAKSSELGAYLITSVQHRASQSGPEGDGGQSEYGNAFTCIPAATQFRPARITPKPIVSGIQSAVVVGPSGEEIYTDKYGRVKVCFHWDREGIKKKDSQGESCSCWIRVSQSHAGSSFGSILIPRMGEEVLVAYLEGDIDQPLVVGRVYRETNMPPFGLPGSKVISGMKSKTYKGSGYNEVVFDDTPGKELIRIHGQFDQDATIENDLREHVLNNRSRDVAVDETISVGSNRTLSIGSNHTITVGSNHTESIGSSMTINVASMLTETVGINYAETVGAAMELTVGAAMTQTVGAVYMLSVGAAMLESVGSALKQTVGGSKSVGVGGSLSEKIGGKHSNTVGGAYSVNAATIALTAKDKITLKTGGASITMESGGKITIKGTEIIVKGSDITMKASGKIGAKAGGDIVMKGSNILQN